MTDEEILTLCAFEEANLEPDDGLAASVRVVLNRARAHFQSDGTISGTVFHNSCTFSWAGWTMQSGRYVHVATTPAQVQARSATLLARDEAYKTRWGHIQGVVRAVLAGTYAGPDYARLTDAAVLYLNHEISHAPWATPDKLICQIGHHSFFRA